MAQTARQVRVEQVEDDLLAGQRCYRQGAEDQQQHPQLGHFDRPKTEGLKNLRPRTSTTVRSIMKNKASPDTRRGRADSRTVRHPSSKRRDDAVVAAARPGSAGTASVAIGCDYFVASGIPSAPGQRCQALGLGVLDPLFLQGVGLGANGVDENLVGHDLLDAFGLHERRPLRSSLSHALPKSRATYSPDILVTISWSCFESLAQVPWFITNAKLVL